MKYQEAHLLRIHPDFSDRLTDKQETAIRLLAGRYNDGIKVDVMFNVLGLPDGWASVMLYTGTAAKAKRVLVCGVSPAGRVAS
tara:strand:+ start:692 stop:940 length:249 start_codon:yes stop_codon:yes gene_type:complete